MDSGLLSAEKKGPRFDPLEPVLPVEVCWIIDRSFSLEVRLLSFFKITFS